MGQAARRRKSSGRTVQSRRIRIDNHSRFQNHRRHWSGKVTRSMGAQRSRLSAGLVYGSRDQTWRGEVKSVKVSSSRNVEQPLGARSEVPMILIVMGPAGAGKTQNGMILARDAG